jgi:sigma-B regulation protein RsbQ
MSAVIRNNVNISGRGTTAIMFAHGFGCDQQMWDLITPAFEDEYKLVLFDHVGAGRSDLKQYNPDKYGTLDGYATDVLEIIEELGLQEVVFVGHSVSSMIGVLAARRAPEKFARLVLIGPSPRYIDADDYVGGFTRESIDELLTFLETNHLGWSSAMAPVIMGNPDRPQLSTRLENSFCSTDPTIARQFARVTFLSDNRADLAAINTPALILQCSSDVIAPLAVGEYCRRNLANSELVVLRATGHCPQISEPEETVAAIKAYLKK